MTRTETRIKEMRRQERNANIRTFVMYSLAFFLSFALCIAAAALGIAIGNTMDNHRPKVAPATYSMEQQDHDMLIQMSYNGTCDVYHPEPCI